MIKIGLCGSSGAGKGYVCEIFKKYGFAHLDTDKIYNDMVSEKGSECLKELCGFFGDEILLPNKILNKKILAKKVFEDENSEKNLKVLNTIAHKHIRKTVEEILTSLEKENCKVAIIDAPVLFESGFDDMCDYTVFVSAPFEAKIERIIKRDKISKEKALARLNSQIPDEKLREKCNFEIKNDDKDNLNEQIENLVKGILIEK